MEKGGDMIMESQVKKYKRTQYFVAKKFQLKYVGMILALMFLTAAMCSYVIYYTLMILLGEKLANVYPQGRLVAIVKTVNFRILLSLLLITPMVTLIGVFLSHRIAGPIYRMERFMANLSAGNLTSKLILRKKDELMTLADGLNALSDQLRDNVATEKSHLNKALEELEMLKKAVESKSMDHDKASQLINRIASELNAVSHQLAKYKI